MIPHLLRTVRTGVFGLLLVAFLLLSLVGCGAPEGKNSDFDRPRPTEKKK